MIHTVALSYIWDNVYAYDKEFRRHMANFPQRSWAMILQQAWSLRLRDRLVTGYQSQTGHNSDAGSSRAKISEACHRFN